MVWWLLKPEDNLGESELFTPQFVKYDQVERELYVRDDFK